jgi:hemerythrin superfamily protein
MANQTIEARQQGNFPADDPTRALMQDHEFVRQLMQRYVSTQDVQVKAMAGPQICEALQMHSSLEEAVFYPRVQELDPALIDRCEEDHHQADEMIAQLQSLKPGDEDYDGLMQQLQQAILSHITMEEQQLFPMVRSSSINLQDLALQMKAYEANLISGQGAGAPSRRPGAQH